MNDTQAEVILVEFADTSWANACSTHVVNMTSRTVCAQSSLGADIYLVTLLCPITLICLAGNGLVMVTMVTNRTLRDPQHYFIFSLAVSDFLNGLLFPVYVTSHTKFNGVQETLGVWEVCDSVLVLLVAAQMASSYNLVTITMGRWLAVKHPMKHRKLLSHKRALLVVLLVWILASVIAVCIYGRKKLDTYAGVCRYELFLNVKHITALLVFTVLLPLLLMILLYILIRLEFRKSMDWFTSAGDMRISATLKSRHIQHEHRLIKMATILLSYFAISWMPFVVYTYVAILSEHSSIDPYIRTSVRLLYFSNSAINVIVYAGRHPDFRHAFRRVLMKWKFLKCSPEETELSMNFSNGGPPVTKNHQHHHHHGNQQTTPNGNRCVYGQVAIEC